jgi:nicotinic acid phosphoribosyltransferase
MHLPTIAETEAHHGPNWQFFELWLAEEYPSTDGSDDKKIEGRKVGAVVEFHGLSGCLTQVFQIHELAEGVTPQHPKDDIDFQEAAVGPLFPTQTDRPHNFCSTLPVDEQPLASTRVIHLADGPLAPEYVTDVEGPLMETGVLDPALFHTIPLQNGAYLKIPKCFDTTLNGQVCLEFGCRRLDGDCHRMVVYGDRAKGCYHTICYDRWRDE